MSSSEKTGFLRFFPCSRTKSPLKSAHTEILNKLEKPEQSKPQQPKPSAAKAEKANGIKSVVDSWEAENYKNSTEAGLLITSDGKEIDFGGTDHHVTGKADDIKLMYGAVFTHNHPTDNTFSQNDIVTGLVKGNLKELRAVTSTGDVHILENNGASEEQRKKFSAAYQQRRMKAANAADSKIRKGERINKDEYVKSRLEAFMSEHAEDYNLTYSKAKIKPKTLEKSVDSGIIREQSKKQITQITDKSIHNIPKVKITGYSDEQCLLIQNHHKELLRYSRDNNSCNEVAFVFSKDLSKKTTFLGTDDKIDFGYLPGSDLFVMHNHPRNSSFSATDIRFLLDSNYQRIKSFSIVKNNGSIEIITKTSSFNVDLLRIDFIRMLKNK